LFFIAKKRADDTRVIIRKREKERENESNFIQSQTPAGGTQELDAKEKKKDSRDQKRTDAKDDAPRSVSRRSSRGRDEDVVEVVVSAPPRFCLHHDGVLFFPKTKALYKESEGWKGKERSLWCSTCSFYY
jgi:hypothetical protein